MACFLASAVEAIAVTVAAKAVQSKEMKEESVRLAKNAEYEEKAERRLPWSKKLMLLAKLLWGGSLLLCFEHVWHGEVVPWVPFLTAMEDPGDTAEMLHEMSTIGVTMAVIVTVVWAIMMFVLDKLLSRPEAETAKSPV